MIPTLKKSRLTSLLGLAWDGSHLEGVVVKRSNGSARVTASFRVPLALDPLNAEAELVGREIRNHLDAAEIRERRCVVCLPLNWVLTLVTLLPDLPEADTASFLEIEAERHFPYGPEALIVSNSIARFGEKEAVALQVAVQRDHVVRLEQVLRAARLTPLSFSLGLPALQVPGPKTAAPVLALLAAENSLGLQAAAGGGLIMLRTLDNALETEGTEKHIVTDVVARELRITLGQLPPHVRAETRALRVFGPPDTADRLVRELAPRAEQMGLTVERAARFAPGELGLELPADVQPTPALALAARHLAGRRPDFEFLPPRVSAWQQLTAKYSSRKLFYAGIAAGAVVVLVLAAFAVQQVQLSRLNSEWAAISPKVRELEALQNQIRQYRPWFDESFRTLSILRRLTEAFPEDGSVTARTVEVRDSAPVTCTGTASNNQALFQVRDRLQAMSEVSDVQTHNLRGSSPVEFTLNFHWDRQN